MLKVRDHYNGNLYHNNHSHNNIAAANINKGWRDLVHVRTYVLQDDLRIPSFLNRFIRFNGLTERSRLQYNQLMVLSISQF